LGFGVADSVVEVLRVREAVGTVLARRGASAEPSFAAVVRAVRLVAVLVELEFVFGNTDERERGLDPDGFKGVTFIPAFSSPRVSISTVERQGHKRNSNSVFRIPEMSPALPLFPSGSRTGENTFFFGTGSAVRFGGGVAAPSFNADGRRRAGDAPEPTRAMRTRAGEGAPFAASFDVCV